MNLCPHVGAALWESGSCPRCQEMKTSERRGPSYGEEPSSWRNVVTGAMSLMVPIVTVLRALAEGARRVSFRELAPMLLLGTILLQSFHFFEHIIQVFQHFVFNDPRGAGLAGSRFDIEPVHLGYNVAFMALLLLSSFAIVRGEGGRSRGRVVIGLMTFTVVFQTYHVIEHSFKIAQFIDTGMNGTPGILGASLNIVWLHFILNGVVTLPILLAFYFGRFYRDMAMARLVSALTFGLGLVAGYALSMVAVILIDTYAGVLGFIHALICLAIYGGAFVVASAVEVTVTRVARRCGCHVSIVWPLLGALAAIGLFLYSMTTAVLDVFWTMPL